MTPDAKRYARDTHFEVLEGIALVPSGTKRDGSPRNTLAIVCYHFTDEREARRFGRTHNRNVFRVDRQRRKQIAQRKEGP